jgi:CDP-glucose 4,6-dehydratase
MVSWKAAMESLVIRREFWSGKRVLVTGHTGFKGSWLVLWLHARGAKIAGYALAPSTDPALWSLLGLTAEIRDEVADVRDLPTLTRAFAAFRPEVVFHMAAQPLVRSSYEDPVETYSTNVMGTVHLLEAVRGCPEVRVVVNVTSDKCYENREWDRGYREGDPMGGYDPYSSSKGCAELVTAAYRNSFFGTKNASTPALASARAGNVIGGGDWSTDRIVPDFVCATVRDEPLRVRNPKAIRPWQHVLDPLSGYLTLAEQLWKGGAAFASAWNFGPDDRDARPVEMLADKLTSLWGQPARWIADPGPHVHEAHFLKLDSSKARAQLGWKPRLGLDNALAWTVEWYKACASGVGARALCLEQIEKFEKLMIP